MTLQAGNLHSTAFQKRRSVMLGAGAGINSRLKNAARAVTSALNKDSRDAGECEDDAKKVKSPQLLFSDLEVDRLKMAFDMHADGDDRVVYAEDLKGLLKTLFIVPTKAEMTSLTSTMDPEQTGKIDFASFFSAMAAFMKPQYGRAMLDRAFDEISGGLNEIDGDSLQRAMIHLGQSTIRFGDCEAMICEVDRQGHGRISRDDFHHLQTCTTDNI